jgi:O-succinylhomoserine sulfhydrylase
MSPFNAWVFLKGLETLRLRMRAHCEHAQHVAEWLAAHPRVARVYYPGLPAHPQHALARAQQGGFGGIVAFEVQGGQPEAWRVVDATRLLSITGNLGDAKSTITHPATTTHARLSPAQRAQAGIRDSLLRVSVGLESPADIVADLARGLG